MSNNVAFFIALIRQNPIYIYSKAHVGEKNLCNLIVIYIYKLYTEKKEQVCWVSSIRYQIKKICV